MTNHITALRENAARLRREMTIAGPHDRAELERLAMRDERLANQLECKRSERILGPVNPRRYFTASDPS